MVFSSPEFLFIFLPICLMVYFLLNLLGNMKINNFCLLIFSILFYAYGNKDFLAILIIAILTNYILTIVMSMVVNSVGRRLLLILIVLANIGLLFVFKYMNLFVSFFSKGLYTTNIILPLGISFYSFQVISYVVDVYNEKVEPCTNVIEFALYILLFPQLIAGPIVRYQTIKEQFSYREINLQSTVLGIERFMLGFVKKMIFANVLGEVADNTFFYISEMNLGFFLSFLGIFCYTLQVYFDFSAYSDMAIGLSKIFGFDIPENFNSPFIASSLSGFWRRWHISLSSFFRDYVYIPLGGSKHGLIRTLFSIFIVFSLSGFWHGAKFNYLFWGIYNAIILILERIFEKKLEGIPKAIRTIFVNLIWIFGMLIFRFEDMSQISVFFNGMFLTPSLDYHARWLIEDIFNIRFLIILCISVLYMTRFFDILYKLINKSNIKFLYYVLLTILFMFSVMEMVANGFNPFIYFRF